MIRIVEDTVENVDKEKPNVKARKVTINEFQIWL